MLAELPKSSARRRPGTSVRCFHWGDPDGAPHRCPACARMPVPGKKETAALGGPRSLRSASPGLAFARSGRILPMPRAFSSEVDTGSR